MGEERDGVSRRQFLKGVSVSAIGAAALTRAGLPEVRAEDAAGAGIERIAASGGKLELAINGKTASLSCEPRATLLSVLRDRLGITGAKDVCDRGACGACTVLVDGKAVVSCMVLAHDCSGKRIETVEGIGSPEKPHALQSAFARCDALQCGFCTPGMVMSLKGLLDGDKSPSLDAIKGSISGNICRCGTYPRIFQAAQEASRALSGAGGSK